MTHVSRWGWRAYALAAAVLILDQLSKFWVMEIARLQLQVPYPVLGPLYFTRIWNGGVSFGLFQAGHELVIWGLVIFNVGVAIMLGLWARRAVGLVHAVGLGLLIGGALGNAIDRARFGAVIDFVDVSRIGFFPWIFNVADSGITVGIIFLILDSLRRERAA